MTTPTDAPPFKPPPRWPQLTLLWAVLGFSAVGAGLALMEGLAPIGVVLLFTVFVNLSTLVASKRRQQVLLSVAPYFYTVLLLSGWVYAFYFSYPSRLAQHLILATLLLLPTIYAQFFTRISGLRAARRAGAVCFSFVVLNLPHALTTLGGPTLFDGLLFTLAFGVSQCLLLAFMTAAARPGDELRRIRQDAVWFQQLAHHDALAGLPNRRQVESVLATTIAQADRNGVPCAALMIDIDHFKRVNDRFSHPVGDAVLRHIAARLRDELRAGSTVGRWGGEEFVVIAPHTELRDAQRLGERLRHAVRSEPAAGKHTLTVSVGITSYRPGDTPETLIARADRALYRAKEAGRDRLEV